MAARRSIQRGTVRRAPVTWSRITSAATVAVAPATKVLLATFTLTGDFGGTVRRTRGRFWVQSDQAAAFENQFGAFGAVVVSDLAIIAGVASIPSPVFDGDDDGWFLLEHIVQGGAQSSTGTAGSWYQFDSKAMRKLEQGFGVAVVVENSSVLFSMQVAIGISLLVSQR